MVQETKTCCHCKEDKVFSEFWKDSSRKDGLHHNCKKCGNEMSKLSYKKNQELHGSSYIPRANRTPEEQQALQRQRANDRRKRKMSEDPNWKKLTEMAYKTRKTFKEVESWFNKQWMRQQAQCAICGKVFCDDDCIDHNHDTNELRGLLCKLCNAGIGMLQDSPEVCLKANEYLIETERK